MQTDTNSPRKPKKKDTEKRNFYIALSVCLLAAAAAAWTTFVGVMDYVKESRTALSPAVSAAASFMPPPPPAERRKNNPSVLPEETPVPAAPEESAEETGGDTDEVQAEETAAYIPSEQFLPPCSGDILNAYSGSTLVFSKTMRDWRTHPGCDFACADGEAVLACANGIVKETRTDPLWGNIIEAEHGDVTLYYCGVGENFAVQAGDLLRQGQVIGVVTAVPCEAAEAQHLHMEAYHGGKPIDFAGLLP